MDNWMFNGDFPEPWRNKQPDVSAHMTAVQAVGNGTKNNKLALKIVMTT
jgi:hypothetical protein